MELQLLRAEIALGKGSHQAERLVREALNAAAAQGFIQTVLDTAPRLADYLVSESVSHPRTDHLAALLQAAMDTRERRARPQPDNLADPLTEAEVKVPKELSQRLTYGDIAYDLHLSLNTVNTDLRHSYMKLGVTSRSAAIRRAASLGLV